MNLERIIAVRTAKTIYRDGNKVIKLCHQDYSKADVLNEALNHARVEASGLHIPRLLEVTMIDGKWAIVLEYIEGKTLDLIMQEQPEASQEHLQRFVGLQMAVHQEKVPLLTMMKDKMHLKISQVDLPAVQRYDLHSRLEAIAPRAQLCHGDFNPSNIVITPQSAAYILDWSHVTQGNADADAAYSYLLFLLNGEEDMAERYLDLYCEKSGTERHHIEQWVPLVAAANSLNGTAKARAFMLSHAVPAASR